jgi:hypothetical protein
LPPPHSRGPAAPLPHPSVAPAAPQPAPPQPSGPAVSPQGTMLFPPAPVQHGSPVHPGPAQPPASGPVPYPQHESGPTQPNSGPPPQAPSGPVPYPHQPSGPTQPYPGGLVPQQGVPQASGGIPQSQSGPSFGQPMFGASGPTSSDPAFASLPQASVVSDGQYHGQEPDPFVGDSLDEIPGSQFVSFLKISARRAFRLRIEPNEVLPSERRSLLRASPPITDLNLQSFLAWRRSVLFLVACALVPLTIIGLIDALTSTKYKAIFFVKFLPAFAELVFLVVCWTQLKRWAHWRTQRRKLFYGWLLFMLTPFIVFIYPLNTIYIELRKQLGSVGAMQQIGIDGVYKQAVLPFVFSMLAMLQLAPKAISLMPGLIRSSMVIKLLFPGSSAPGWLIVIASPMYALLAYVILIIPYQFTGSGWFIAGILGVVAAQSVLARAGFQLAKPQSEEEALIQIKKVRRYYVIVMMVSAVLIVIALGSLVWKLNLRWTDVIMAVLKFESNVLILTMIGADLVVTNLDKARHYTAGRDHVEDATENKIAAFVSFEAPPPPPPGPAP